LRNLATTASKRNPRFSIGRLARSRGNPDPRRRINGRCEDRRHSPVCLAGRRSPDTAHVRRVGVRPQVQGRPLIRKLPQTATRAVRDCRGRTGPRAEDRGRDGSSLVWARPAPAQIPVLNPWSPMRMARVGSMAEPRSDSPQI
jgi:hypothetical protein